MSQKRWPHESELIVRGPSLRHTEHCRRGMAGGRVVRWRSRQTSGHAQYDCSQGDRRGGEPRTSPLSTRTDSASWDCAASPGKGTPASRHTCDEEGKCQALEESTASAATAAACSEAAGSREALRAQERSSRAFSAFSM